MTTKPFPYQAEGVARIEGFGGRALLADDMGLGKSFQALLYLRSNRSCLPAVVVCPANIKWQWQREALVHFGMRAEVLEGTSPPKYGLPLRADLVVVNYDILHAWLGWLRGLGPGLVVIDECHAVKDPRTRRTKAVRELCRGVGKVVAMSGTPMVNRPAELFPVLNLLRPDLFPSFWAYGQRFCSPRRAPWGWEYKGATRLDELNQILLDNLMVRRRKEDVLKDLPERTRTVVPVDLSDPDEYRMADERFLEWLRKRWKGRARRAAKAEKLTQVGYLKRLAGELKLPAVQGWVESWLEGGGDKLILYGVHQHVIGPLRKRWGKLCATVTGETPAKERQKAVDQFNQDSRTRLFLGNIQAAGVGWSAKACSAVAFAEMGWTPGEHSQAEDRVRGIGRGQAGRGAQAYYLVARGTVEEELARLLQRKMANVGAALDGGEGDGLDVFDLLLEALAKKGGL